MSRPPKGGSRFKGLAAVPRGGNGKPAARDVQPAFEGTIAGICETVISLEEFIGMARWAKESDPRVARFLETWDALSASEQQPRAADAVCKRIGLAPLDLLKAVADAACRVSMYTAQIIAAVSHPLVVEKTVERALTDEGIADRMAFHKATGFLPTPKGSQTIISIMQNAQTNVPAQAPVVSAPSPEETIRRIAGCFNELERLPRTAASALPENTGGHILPYTIPDDGDAMPAEFPEEGEGDGK